MNMQLAINLLPYISLAISLVAFLGLFSALNRKVEKLRIRLAKFEAQMEQTTDLSPAVGELKKKIEELEPAAPGIEIPTGKPASLNGTVRSKVLKMHRLGQPVERIADSLRVPKGEVDLLVKVHQIVMRPYEQVPAKAERPEAS
ncbi:MAG TPA: hypothetical protein VNV82_23790 [Bryobacteraceae bacterium]|nr:hypothetical protein [Bryobacteraceae bacterium]